MEEREPLEVTIISDINIVITAVCPGKVYLKEFCSPDPFNSSTGDARQKEAWKTKCSTLTQNDPKCFVAIHKQKTKKRKRAKKKSDEHESNIGVPKGISEQLKSEIGTPKGISEQLKSEIGTPKGISSKTCEKDTQDQLETRSDNNLAEGTRSVATELSVNSNFDEEGGNDDAETSLVNDTIANGEDGVHQVVKIEPEMTSSKESKVKTIPSQAPETLIDVPYALMSSEGDARDLNKCNAVVDVAVADGVNTIFTDNKELLANETDSKAENENVGKKKVAKRGRKAKNKEPENYKGSSTAPNGTTTSTRASSVRRSSRPQKRKWAVDDVESDVEIKEEEKEFKCKKCGKVFYKQASLNSHMVAHRHEKELECKICGKVFAQTKYLTVHYKRHEGNKKHKCNLCDKYFISKSEAQLHELKHSDKKPYSCNVCGNAYKSKFTLQQHMTKHTGVKHPSALKRYPCHLCDKVFIGRKAYLTIHLKRHAGEKKFKCSHCGVRMVTKSELLAHEARHTGEKNHSCEICGKAFFQRYEVDLHLKSHTGEKLYTCEICGRGFMKKTSYVGHVKLHNNQKDFVCDICGKSFSIKNSLNIHLKKHDDTKVNTCSCNICGRTFSMYSKLKRHLMTHSGEKPFICDVCGFQTADKSSLDAHKRRHTGEKPYPCKVCGKPFRAARQRTVHEKIHSKTIDRRRRDPNEIYKCDVCEKIFERRAQLTRHRKRHNKNNTSLTTKSQSKRGNSKIPSEGKNSVSQESNFSPKEEKSTILQQEEAIRNLILLEAQPEGDGNSVTVIEESVDNEVSSPKIIIYYQGV